MALLPLLTQPLPSRQPVTGSGWTAATLDAPERWYYRLSPESNALLRRALRDADTWGRPVTELRLSAALRYLLTRDLMPLRGALDTGRGFAILEGFADVSDWEAKAFYWLIGQALGTPLAQNVQGTVLYDVHDTSQNVEYGARFSTTDADSSFHTDASFADLPVDYVGLLCLRTARSGGINHLVDGRTAWQELSARAPREATWLEREYHVDRRDGVRAGEAPTVRRPVVERVDGRPHFRYLRPRIEAGHQKAEEPLTVEQLAALDLLDFTLRRRELQAELSLAPGEILWLNNRSVLHRHAAFEDYPEPERRQHLVRLWLGSKPQSE
jgi:alpha-ketoglutarate-dependent taurine dioxygenase